jgi:hypothetical protein
MLKLAMLIATTFSLLQASSQSLTNQTNLYVPIGLELHIDGDFANEGFVENLGNMLVTGNWKNSNVYQGSGIVTLNGDLRQGIFNNKNPVAHLVINGLGIKDVTDLLPVTNRLDLFRGIVNVADADTLFLPSSATVGGGSLVSHVNGAFTYAGAGYKFFPIGKNGNYNPVEMLNITGINPVTELEVFEDLPAIKSPPEITLYSKIYWQRKSIRGTYTESPLAIGFQVPDNFTNRHVLEIVEGSDLNDEFTAIGRVSVTYDNVLDKVVSDDGLKKNIFVIGESTPRDGIAGKFYFSTSLSPRAADPDNQAVKIFGDQLVAEGFRFLVYNRWGLLVYENASLESMILTGWDGKNKSNGEYLPSGAYPYLLRAMTKNGEVLERKGMISIIN